MKWRALCLELLEHMLHQLQPQSSSMRGAVHQSHTGNFCKNGSQGSNPVSIGKEEDHSSTEGVNELLVEFQRHGVK